MSFAKLLRTDRNIIESCQAVSDDLVAWIRDNDTATRRLELRGYRSLSFAFPGIRGMLLLLTFAFVRVDQLVHASTECGIMNQQFVLYLIDQFVIPRVKDLCYVVDSRKPLQRRHRACLARR